MLGLLQSLSSYASSRASTSICESHYLTTTATSQTSAHVPHSAFPYRQPQCSSKARRIFVSSSQVNLSLCRNLSSSFASLHCLRILLLGHGRKQKGCLEFPDDSITSYCCQVLPVILPLYYYSSADVRAAIIGIRWWTCKNLAVAAGGALDFMHTTPSLSLLE